jgi:hypothetical protein
VLHAANALGHAIGNASSQALRDYAELDSDLQAAIKGLLNAAW